MKFAPRCMRCATTLGSEHGTGIARKVRMAFRRSLYCPHCKMNVPKAGAIAMGHAYGIHLSHLRKEMTRAAQQLSQLELNEALRALDPKISREDIQPAHTIENLLRCAREAYRSVLLDLAHGRQSSLDIGLKHDAKNHVIAAGAGVFPAPESGEHESDMLFARVGGDNYIVYLPKHPTLWLHQAIRHKTDSTAVKIHVGPPSSSTLDHP